MNKTLKKYIAVIISAAPFSFLRVFLYNLLLGYKISRSATVGFLTVIVADGITIEHGSVLGKFIKINGRCIQIGKFCTVKSDSTFNGAGALKIGDRVVINRRSHIDLADSVCIGNDVVIAGRDVEIWTHGFDNLRNKLVGAVVIGDSVYVGSRSIILPGVSIASDCVVSAGTVVSRPVHEPHSVVFSGILQTKRFAPFAGRYTMVTDAVGVPAYKKVWPRDKCG